MPLFNEISKEFSRACKRSRGFAYFNFVGVGSRRPLFASERLGAVFGGNKRAFYVSVHFLSVWLVFVGCTFRLADLNFLLKCTWLIVEKNNDYVAGKF